MLAGCTRWNDSMTTQRFDFSSGIAKREAAIPRLGFPRRPGDSSCSFRPIPTMPAAAGVISHSTTWGSSARCSMKRSHEWDDDGDECVQIPMSKRSRLEDAGFVCRGGDDSEGGGGSGDHGGDVWFPRAIDGDGDADHEAAAEEKVVLVPQAALFAHTAAAAAASTSYVPKKESFSPSGSFSSSDADSSQQRGEQSPSIGEPGERHGIEVVGLLTACAESIAGSNHEAAGFFLARLGEQAAPASTPVHRMAAYFTEAFALRLTQMWPLFFDINPPREAVDYCSDDDAMAMRILNSVTPIPRFIHFTMNERLLRAFDGEEKVHVIDFDIKQGLQWPCLFRSLASMPRPPAHVRITGVGDSRQDLLDTGAMLARFAEASGLAFEFHAVVDRLEDVRLWMLHVTRDECVAVNCVSVLHRLLADETGAALTDFLDLVKSTNPKILAVAEQEAEHNAGRWEARLASAMQHYAALFDAVDSGRLPRSSPARAKAEEMFGREIRNVVACEGRDRVERHESFGNWRAMMEARGLRSAGVGEREAVQARMIARMFAPARYAVAEQRVGPERAGLTLKWRERALYTVSAWQVSDQ